MLVIRNEKMKLAYIGDCVLQNTRSISGTSFVKLGNDLFNNDCRLIINLESPFVKGDELSIKNKITLSAAPESIRFLDYLKPYLINLANNHINDYGNKSVLFTQELLNKHHFHYWGVGYKTELNSNIWVDSNNKIINIAYVTRNSDFTGSLLFADVDLIGGFPPNLKQVELLRKKYRDFSIIVNIHWGREDILYPEPDKRELAHKLIDTGVDLIIGHHPHIIQYCEYYKDKLIYYSIGNFYFPAIQYKIDEKMYYKYPLRHQRIGLIPIIEINHGVIDRIITWEVTLEDSGELSWIKNVNLSYLSSSMGGYKIFYKGYEFLLLLKRISTFFRKNYSNPKLFFSKILKKIS